MIKVITCEIRISEKIPNSSKSDRGWSDLRYPCQLRTGMDLCPVSSNIQYETNLQAKAILVLRLGDYEVYNIGLEFPSSN